MEYKGRNYKIRHSDIGASPNLINLGSFYKRSYKVLTIYDEKLVSFKNYIVGIIEDVLSIKM